MDNVLTVKFSDKEFEQLNNYAKTIKKNLSDTVKNLVLDMLDDSFLYDKEIVESIKIAEKGKSYTFEEAKKLVGV